MTSPVDPAGTPAPQPAGPQRSGSPASGPVARPPRRRRGLRIALVVAALLAVAVAVGLAWLGSESATRVLLDRAVAATGGRLEVEAPSGTLLGAIRSPRIAWRDAGLDVTVTDAAVGIDPRALLRGTLRLRILSAAGVDVTSAPSDAPPAPPATLALPVGVEIPDARVDRLTLRQTGSDAVTVLDGLRVSARHARGAWTVDALTVTGPFGTLHAGGSIASAPPFAVSARALLETKALDEPVAIDATASGPLESLSVDARTVLRDASASVRAKLAPFAAQPLGDTEATLSNVDLSRFADGLPATRLAGRLQLSPRTGAAGAAGASPVPPLSGSVTLRNARPGTLDAGLLPLETIDLKLAFDGARLRLSDVSLAGPPGRLAGEATLTLPGGTLPPAGTIPDFRLAASTDGLDLRSVHAGLRQTALRGEVRVAPAEGGLAAEGRLADGDLSLEGRARWAGTTVFVERARLQAQDGTADVAGTVGAEAPYRFDLAGTFARLDPSRFADVPPGLLNGRWRARGEAGARPSVDASVSLADSRLRGLALSGEVAARWEPERIRDVDASLKLGATSLTARGALGARGDRLAVSVDAQRLEELDARSSGRATLQGELGDALRAPAVAATLKARELRVADAGSVRTLQATVALPQPRALGEVLRRLGLPGGEALAAAPPPLEPGAPRVGRGTAASGRSQGARPTAQASPGRDAAAEVAPIAVSVRADGIVARGTTLDTLAVDLSGDADRHVLAVRATAAQRRDARTSIDAALRAEGALARDGGPRWTGRIVDASNAGAPRLRLLAPADVVLAADAASIGPLRVEIDGAGGARLDLDAASWREGRVRLAGVVSAVPIRWLGPLAEGRGLRVDDPGALRLGARVDLTGSPGSPGSSGDLRGRVDVYRESGDLVMEVPAAGGGVETLRAGLQALEARVEIGDGRIAATAALRGDAIGTMRADARAPLAWNADGTPDPNVPLQGAVELSVPSLAFARALAGDAWRFDGALKATLALAGTLASPDVSGRIEGSRMVAEQREVGMRLVDGELVATVRGQTVDVETLRFRSGAGTASITGSLRADERSEAVVTLDRMPIPLGAGQRLILSGQARATLREGVLRIRGALRADEGVIELTANNAPRVSKDVIVVRDAAEAAEVRAARRAASEGNGNGAAEPDPEAGRGFRILSDLEIDLGDRFRVFGAGVDARLEGRLTLRGRLPDAPRLTGTVRIAQGTYMGFGQKLEIERGTLVFSGPIDNPAIDIRAFRRFLPVEAGVALTGTAKVPRLALVSKPDVPDQEKLSWLVLGTGTDTSRSGQQNAALAAAAATLLATADPNARVPNLASTFGLDVITVRTGQVGASGESTSAAASAQDSVVTLGKRLTDRLFVSYEQSLRGITNLLRLQYEITERLSVRLKTGSENALDLLWTVRYD